MARKRKPRTRRARANGISATTAAPASSEPSDGDRPPAGDAEPGIADDFSLETDDTGTFVAPELAADGVADDRADDAADGGVALTSLQRLENDIQELHSRWADVEGELATRYMEIARLEEDRSVQFAAFEALQAEFDEAEIREQELQAELQSRNERLDATQADAAEHARQLDAKDKLIADDESKSADLQANLDASHKAKQELQNKLEAQRKKDSDAHKEIHGLKARITDLKITVTDLESYIDRRKAEWHQQNTDLEHHRDALSEMEHKLKGMTAKVSKEKDAKTELNAEISKLQNRCAELDGRRAERELANQELQDRLTESAAEIEAVRHELRGAENASEPLQTQLEEHRSQLDAARTESARLQSELDELRQDTERARHESAANAEGEIKSLRTALDTAQENVAGLQLRLTDSDQRLDGLQAELAEERGKMQQGFDAAQAADARVAGMLEERDKLRSEVEGLSALLEEVESEFSEYRNATAIDLDASVQRSAELKHELEDREAALRSLDRNVAMMDKINATVQRLDDRILASKSLPDAEAETDGDRPGVRRLMVAVHGKRKVRYPLYKNSMTIGRSRDADIQVRQKWISREHARIVVDDNTVTIEDLGSKNGIQINNQVVHAGELHNEDVVEIGDTQFQFIDLMDTP